MTDIGVQGTISYSNRGSKQKLLIVAIKTGKSYTTKNKKIQESYRSTGGKY